MKQCGIKAGELDLLFGGPPCQTFSQIGKQGSLRDARGKLLFSMVEYARKLKPRAILIENVKALQSAPNLAGKRGGVVQDLKQELESIGYKVSSRSEEHTSELKSLIRISYADFCLQKKRRKQTKYTE